MQVEQETQRVPSKTLLVIWNEFLDKLRKKLIRLAIFLEKTRFIYALYGAADGLNLYYTVIKYIFDIKNNLLHITSNIAVTKDLQDWLKNADLGLLMLIITASIFILFSILGNLFKDQNNNNRLIIWLTLIWPYIRDSIKAIKNAYKGWRSALSITLIFKPGAHLLLPLGIGFGVLSLAIKLPRKRFIDIRKDLQDISAKCIKELSENNTENLASYREKFLINPLQQHRKKLFAMAVYSGFIDGLYQHMNLIAMGPMCPLFFSIISIFSLVILILNIMMRLYEEYDYQKRLEKARLEALKKIYEIEGHSEEASKCQQQLDNLHTSSAVISILSGLKKGITVYVALTSITFFTNAILMIGWSYSIPPIGILATACLGLSLIIGFIAKELCHYHATKNQAPAVKSPSKFSEWGEFFRNLFYGFPKGVKAVDFIGNTKLNIDTKRNKISYPAELKIWAIICAFVNAAILALWALTKGFGKTDPAEVTTKTPTLFQPTATSTPIPVQLVPEGTVLGLN